MMKAQVVKSGVMDAALVTFGWFTFVVSFFVADVSSVLMLQSIARVLP